MFAVPGWSSVSAEALKAETVNSAPKSAGAKARKRKRNNANKEEDVTSGNLADLYESVVEGKKPVVTKEDKSAKRQKKDAHDKAGPKPEKNRDAGEMKSEAGQGDSSSKRNKDKKNKKNKGGQDQDQSNASKSPKGKSADADAASAATTTPPLPPAPAKLTPLQAAMREKLVSARFRHLNETLYTRPSEEAYKLFQESPEMFDEYHEGFRRQVKVWPENPVDSFLKDIRTRGKIRQPPRGKPSARPTSLAGTILPRTAGTCTIADLGCGDAQLAQSMQTDKGKLRIDIKSYDLQNPHPLVTKADIANLPLEDGSVNVAIFCLALMGTNWVDFIEEAFRILHWKGELWVAEIKSRFGPVRNKHAPVEHSVGNRKKVGKKAKGDGFDPSADLAVEVDGAEDHRRETDVSAFVDALKTRGFVLNGERSEAIDLSNKMFVKMRFIKGATPTKGKGAKAAEPGRGRKPTFAPRVGEDKAEEPEINEASILKPCVYKIR